MNTEFNATILDDIKAYIDVAKEKNENPRNVLCHILHDCEGILNDVSCFVPRVHGYANLAKLKKG